MSYFYHLPAPVILLVEGRDSPRYMNARLTNDMKGLPVGQTASGAALTPQGRTQAFFRVKRLEEQKFLLLCDGGEREAVISAFKKYLVADRVTVTDLSDSHAAFHLTGALPSLPEGAHVLPSRRTLEAGHDVIVSREAAFEQSLSGSVRLDSAAYHAERIAAGIPSFPEELNEEALFSEAELRDAISFKKGCYVGQEVVEKIDAIGKVAHVLRPLRFPGEVTIPRETEVRIEGITKQAGEILTSAFRKADGMTYAFASLRNLPEAKQGAKVEAGTITGEIVR